MYSLKEIKSFLNRNNYDLRKKDGASRWIDQKCTPDVVWSISDYILNYIEEDETKEFTTSDIWHSKYAKETVDKVFSKPNTDEKKAKREYDKFFGQPMRLLCYAGILEDKGINGRHLYKVKNIGVLEYVADIDINTYNFLVEYIIKVLKDSGLYKFFDDFFIKQNAASFKKLKETIEKFYYNNTDISNKREIDRIFTKILNPLACLQKKKGTFRGHISKRNIPFSDIMYNRDNFRDLLLKKPKDMTREEWINIYNKNKKNIGYYQQQMSHAKNEVKKLIVQSRGGISELTMFDKQYKNEKSDNLHIHHIFPKDEFPEIMHYKENLIGLTTDQHLGKAHPKNHTREIDISFQKKLLIVKISSIKYNIEKEKSHVIYSFNNFTYVLSVGWNDESILKIKENDYNRVLNKINVYYANI